MTTNTEAVDYFAEYRDKTPDFPQRLFTTARFGVDEFGTMHEVDIPESLQHHEMIEPMVAAINKNDFGKQPYAYSKAFEHIVQLVEKDPNPNWNEFSKHLLVHLKENEKSVVRKASKKTFL